MAKVMVTMIGDSGTVLHKDALSREDARKEAARMNKVANTHDSDDRLVYYTVGASE